MIYISIDEPPNEVYQNMRSFGWDIDRVQVFDATPDVMSYDKTPVRDVSTERKVVYFKEMGGEIRQTSDRCPVDMTVSTIQELLKQEMRQRKYSRVVVDSLTSLKFFYIKTSEENATLISFFRLLSDLGVTSLVTVQLPEISKPEVEVHIARGEIRLHKWIDGRGMTRGVTIEKFRGSSHDSRLRSMKISSDGVTVKTLAGEKAENEAEDKEMETPPPAPAEALPAASQPPSEPPPPQAEALPPPEQPQDTPPPPPPDVSHEGGSGI